MQKHWLLLIGFAAAAGLFGLLAQLARPRDRGLSEPWPLEPRSHLLSEPERVLFKRLVQSLPEYVVLTQVQLLQILEFQRGRRTRTVFNRICQLSVDFLILNPDTSIRLVIELDDNSHGRRGRPWSDARKTHALKSASVPLIRWRTRALPDAQAIRAAVVGEEVSSATRA